ncbi:shTK domain protein [Necator americanus]|uniref:ShTK domain protein n=1 Tax=Necator americanus TaxID=51031 RepID=W2T4G2_NECAM|nr:shTK domain protein [Necator americanus]ETN75847.1 shTK domain protein [Necator americanus]
MRNSNNEEQDRSGKETPGIHWSGWKNYRIERVSHHLRVAALSQSDENEEECIDKSPYCNTNDCTVRPGYALEYCKKTCGDCERT